ncbi:O-antigen ligase family protein [Sinomicrobium sp. M5D2P9]
MGNITKHDIYGFSLSMFLFSLSFAPDWSSKALIFLVIVFILNLKPNRKQLSEDNVLKVLTALTVYAVLNMLFLSGTFSASIFKLTGLCLIFCLMISQSDFKAININKAFLAFVLGVFVVGTINLIAFGVEMVNNGYSGFFNTWQTFSIIDIDKIYYAVYINMAYLITVDCFSKKIIGLNTYILVTSLSVILFLYTGAVSGILVFILLNVLLAAKKVWKKGYTTLVFFTFLTPLILMIGLSFKPVQDVFQKIDGEGSRMRNYNINKEIVIQMPFFGHGIGKEMETMQNARKSTSWEYQNKYNAHNQYFQYLIGGGIVLLSGIISLLFILLYRPINKEAKLLTIGFCLILLYIFIIESFLERHHGLMFFAFFFNALLFLNRDKLADSRPQTL